MPSLLLRLRRLTWPQVVHWSIRRLPVSSLRRRSLDLQYLQRRQKRELSKATTKEQRSEIEGSYKWDIWLGEEAVETVHSDLLRKQADRLHLPLPSGEEYWARGDYTEENYLTRAGCEWMREKIRTERKARWEDRSRPLTLGVTLLGAVFAFVAAGVGVFNAHETWTEHHHVDGSHQKP
jgi:hypothetical protein